MIEKLNISVTLSIIMIKTQDTQQEKRPKILRFITASTPEEKELFVAETNTSIEYLRLIGNGLRHPKPQKRHDIVKCINELAINSEGRFPKITKNYLKSPVERELD